MNTVGNKAAKKALNGTPVVPPAPAPRAGVKVALVLGGADCLEADRREALKLFTPDLIVATNEAGRDHEGKVDHWVTFHPDKFPGWIRERRKKGLPDAGTLWIPEHRTGPAGFEYRKCVSYGGSSGLLCCFVVIKWLECRAVLVGCPMQAEHSHYWDAKARPWKEAPAYWDAWKSKYPFIKAHIRSMSGKTRELLGAPDRAWLNGER